MIHRLALLTPFIIGCSWYGPGADAGADAGAPVLFVFLPADRTSAVDPDPPTRLRWFAESADDPRIAETTSRLQLTSQSSGASIAIDTRPPAVGESRFIETDVVSTSLLAEGFYRLWVGELPDGVGTLQTQSPDGTYGVRFRVGTYPLLAGIQVCPHQTGTDPSIVSVVFSEPMADGAAAQIEIEAASCGPGEQSGSTVIFTCGPIARDATLTVRIDAAIRGASGATLMHPEESAGAHTFAIDELEWLLSCGTYWGYWPTPY